MPVFVSVALAEDDYLAKWYEDIIEAILLGMFFLAVTSIATWLLGHQIQTNILAKIVVAECCYAMHKIRPIPCHRSRR